MVTADRLSRKKIQLSLYFCFEKIFSGEFRPWIFLVPAILMKLLFLYSIRAKLLEYNEHF
jgi:hypothetical protein